MDKARHNLEALESSEEQYPALTSDHDDVNAKDEADLGHVRQLQGSKVMT
jgi:hypothetical protein